MNESLNAGRQAGRQADRQSDRQTGRQAGRKEGRKEGIIYPRNVYELTKARSKYIRIQFKKGQLSFRKEIIPCNSVL